MAMNFEHNDSNFVPLWDRKQTGAFLGRHKSYPLLGLGEVGNITTVSPNIHFCDDVSVPYAQAYTPFVKPFDGNIYEEHPYLLTHLLGAEYIRSTPKFRHLVECTDNLKEYR